MTSPHPDFPNEYYHDADLRVVQAVPADARSILDIDCGEGRLGEVLKHLQPARKIIGITKQRELAETAAGRLDHVLVGDIENDTLNLGEQTFDCIIAADTLVTYANPQAVLERLHPLLRSGGHLITSLPNMQHWSIFESLLRGDLQRRNAGLLANSHRQCFAVANLIKLFLDAGYLPRITDRRSMPAPAGWLTTMRPIAEHMGLDQTTFAVRTQTWQYVIDARAIDNLPSNTSKLRPVTVGACTNDEAVLRDNLLASPCLNSGQHETLMVEGATSAGEGLNAVIAQAQHELVVLAHQDVYLPGWWIARLWQQYEKTRLVTGDKVGVMGVYGVLGTPQGILHSGRVADRDFLLDEPTPLPAQVGSLDELVLIVPRNTPLRFDPALGFHLYGTDICLSATRTGLHGIVIDAPCYHNSKLGNELPSAFQQSAGVLRKKWNSALPIPTACTIIN